MEVEPSLLFGPMWPALWWMRSAFIQFDHPVQPLVQICVWTRMSWPEILFNTAGIRDINHQRKPLIFWLSLSHLLHNANNNENKAKEQSSYIKESGLLPATKLITEVLSYRQTQKEMGGREVKKEEKKKKAVLSSETFLLNRNIPGKLVILCQRSLWETQTSSRSLQ